MKASDIQGWCGIVMAISFIAWLAIKPSERHAFSWAPLPVSSSGLKNLLAAIFHIAWLAGIASLFPKAWLFILIFLAVGIVSLALRIYLDK